MAMTSSRLLAAGETLNVRARVHWWHSWPTLGLRNLWQDFLVTDRRIIERRGLITISVRALALDQVETIEATQPLWRRLLGYGHLTITGSGGQVMHWSGLADAARVAQAIGSTERGPK